ncbi:hypothetical protein [Pseudomonas monteilii]|uniref:hypothetical protein n=1 Tax=Pseudomonas monteilii TaxID=76759 RepID=UPI0015F9872D|nr:hypothetical protein [Pseudomonas monteilii]MBA6106008.1 hypothetical protein [Pseudomonas monteilii]
MSIDDDAPSATPLVSPDHFERSELFVFFKERMMEVYRSPEREAVDQYGLIVVGGQALSLWAREYLLDEMTGEELQFATSDDLDFIGRQGSVGFCEERMNVRFRRATLEDHTPNLAAAEIAWDDGRKLVIDILDAIAGVQTKDIYKYLESVVLDGVRVAVIDPVSCLQSRLFNLYAPWCSNHERECVRTKLAIRASNCYLREILVEDGYRAAVPLFKRIHDLALSRHGKDAFYDYGLDLLQAIPIDPSILPKQFIEQNWPNIVKQVEDARTRKVIQYQSHNREPLGLKFSAPAAESPDSPAPHSPGTHKRPKP